MDRFLGQPPLDHAIAALAARQHAVVGVAELLDLGLSVDAARQRAAAGRLHRIHRGVYALVPKSLLIRNGLYMAAVLACGPGALLSHRSAAVLHGLIEFGGAKVDVAIPRRTGRAHKNLAVHRSLTLTSADATVVDGIPCTTVARTLFDISEVLPRRPVEKAFDRSEQLQVFDLGAINDQLARNPTRPGARVLKAILHEHYIGSTLTESELEEAMLLLSRAVGLPAPEVQQWLDLGDGEGMIRPDFMWRTQRLIVEVDGAKYHRTRQRFESDRRRDQRALVAGWRVLRTTDRQIKRRPEELRETIARLLAQTLPSAAGSPAAAAGRAPRRR